MVDGSSRRGNAMTEIRSASGYKLIKEVMEEEVYALETFKRILFDTRRSIPDSLEFIDQANTRRTEKLKKVGTTLILTAPVPIISDIIGIGLFTTGVLTEYRKRKKLQEALNNYIELLVEPMNT